MGCEKCSPVLKGGGGGEGDGKVFGSIRQVVLRILFRERVVMLCKAFVTFYSKGTLSQISVKLAPSCMRNPARIALQG